ncbi:MAG: exodeoxyribonuclease V subunit beta [Xanthomonadales bacterium]|nr:exodeoxyribonuclease V subunit beta [Xanthomonadales bacterium]
MTELKPFAMPLDGITLIEASAGTGKTYNITSLYLRQLLEQALTVEQILVVTFTKDATEELRSRIRQRVQQALAVLQSADTEAACKDDPELSDWLKQRAEYKAIDEVRLRAAVVSIDEAAVFTIHGYCQRMLQDNAFATGMAFELDFIEDEAMLRQQAAEDFWRQWFGNKQADQMINRLLIAQWSTPDALLSAVSEQLQLDEVTLLPEIGSVSKLEKQLRAKTSALERLHQKLASSWQQEASEVEKILTSDSALNRHSYNKSAVEKALKVAAEVSVAKNSFSRLNLGAKFELLTTEILQEKTKAKFVTPENPFFEICSAYQQQVEAIKQIISVCKTAFLLEARGSIKQHLSDTKIAAQQLYFNDLLSQLDNALQGDLGSQLAAHLSDRYPVAMIDEFQDTDAVQYRIFKTIYTTIYTQANAGSLCLIGDPKQAIYSFRGGDIFTYMQAVKDADQRYSLGVNWRSSTGLVQAVNCLFSQHAGVFIQDAIQYQPVQASPNADKQRLTIAGAEPAPLLIWKLESNDQNSSNGCIRIGDARDETAAHCANHTLMLLAESSAAQIGNRQVEARDIAILVRSHVQAALVQNALRAKGINSVTLSNKSVFETEEASALLNLLHSVEQCNDSKLLRFVLAGRFFGYSAKELQALNEDSADWEQIQRRFSDYRYRWKQQGFMQAFQQLFKSEGLAARMLQFPDGERRLTNLLQLLELSQQAARTRPGVEELQRWLQDEIEHSSEGDAAKLRLESDAGLVKIVTMHSAKGLEYPVVYIPFPWSPPVLGIRGNAIFYHDENKQPCLQFCADKKQLEAVNKYRQKELRAEDVRLFYVAITRAAKLCVMSMGKINTTNNSAFAWLLFPAENGVSSMGDCTEQQIFSRLDELAIASGGSIEVAFPPAELPRLHAYNANTVTAPVAKLFKARIEHNWWVNSYSRLTRGKTSERPDYDASSINILAPGSDEIQALPAGPGFGLFVHELFEHLDFTQYHEAALQKQIQGLAVRYNLVEIKEDKINSVVSMVKNVLATRLPDADLKLEQLERQQRLDEMEFYFSVGQLSQAKLQRTLADFPDWENAAAQLNFPEFKGMMHGFIDLIFRHNGRYYLADYKSNRLQDYAKSGLDTAMQIHHYPLQGLIYSLALHRYLQQRLTDYSFANHFGGVYYLFTRGMKPGSTDGIWFRRPDEKLIISLDDCFGRGL